MWKLLIAEDETTIRKGLRYAADWEDYSVTIVGEAEDGEIALEMAMERQPDILFVDINMPFLNGLELMRALREHLPEAIFIVISGYDEFSYAQQALKMDAFDYLLKPVNKEDLIKTVKNAVKLLEKNNRRRQLDLQLEDNKALLKEKFLQEWAAGMIAQDEVKEQSQLLSLHLEGPVGISMFKVVKEIEENVTQEQWNDGLISFSLKNIIKDYLKAYSSSEVFEDSLGHIILLLPNAEGEVLMRLNKEIKEYAEGFLGKVIICMEKLMMTHLELPDHYRMLKEEIAAYHSLSPMVILAKDYIDHHYFEPSISLNEVAEMVQVSPTYLSKRIKTELGASFITYLTKVRIKKALLLMKDPHLKIYEIADMVGYSTQHYFCNAFKKVTGISPTVYRGGAKSYE
ncbi:response regulator [Neobacillus niacini]|uniref:response regulator transcription factor n=1 Tax=Neobacillus niacini TaxID=86668 RepID=UPI003983CCC3